MDAVEAKQTNPSSNSTSETNLTENQGSGNSSSVLVPSASKRPLIDCGDLEMRIARDGTWHYRGSPINRLPLVRLFASVLRRECDGRYWLVTPAERGRIEVEDAPFLAVELTFEGAGHDQRGIFRTNLDEFVTMGPDNPLRVDVAASGEPRPYILVRNGLEARIVRPVFYELVDAGTEEWVGGALQFGVWSLGVFFRLGEPGPDWD
jgi:hypothetical protein